MKAAKLLGLCQKCITEYTGVQHKTPINLFADDFLDAHLGSKDNNEGEFVRQVLYGTNRYNKLTQGMLDRMYEKYGLATPADNVMNSIISYIAILRLTELPIKEFRRLVLGQNPIKMRQLLSYIFLEGSEPDMTNAWCLHYSDDFVEDSLIAPLADFKEDIESLCVELDAKSEANTAEKSGAPTAKVHKTIEVQPFNLTKPKPRIVPEPEVLPARVKAKGAPDMSGSIEDTVERRELRELRAENRRAEQEKYSDPQQQPFVLASDSRPTHLEALQEEEAMRVEDATRSHFKAQPAPKLPAKPAAVRMNVTTILREDTLYKKKQEKEAALINEYEANLQDSSEFYEWQAKRMAEDDAMRTAQIEQRRHEMAASALHAMEAKERDLEFKSKVAKEMKVESTLMGQQLKEEKEQMRLYNRQIADDVRQMEKFAAIAMSDEKQRREEQAAEIKIEQMEIEKRIAENIELERQRKADAVQWQRAQEEISREKKVMLLANKFDPTTTKSEATGDGTFLNEMSYIEMKERTSIQKGKDDAVRESRRQDIVEAKIDKERRMRDKAEELQRIRLMARDDNQKRKSEKKTAVSEKARLEKERNDVKWIELHSQIQAKKKKKKDDEERLAAEVKAIEIKRQFLNADAAKVEELKWLQLEKGAEREAREKQRVNQEEALRGEKLKEKESIQKARNVRGEMRGKQKFLNDYNVRVSKAAEKDAGVRKAREQSKIARSKIQHAEEVRQRKAQELGPVNGLSRVIRDENIKADKLASTRTMKLGSGVAPTQKAGLGRPRSSGRPTSSGTNSRPNSGRSRGEPTHRSLDATGTLPSSRYGTKAVQ